MSSHSLSHYLNACGRVVCLLAPVANYLPPSEVQYHMFLLSETLSWGRLLWPPQTSNWQARRSFHQTPDLQQTLLWSPGSLGSSALVSTLHQILVLWRNSFKSREYGYITRGGLCTKTPGTGRRGKQSLLHADFTGINPSMQAHKYPHILLSTTICSDALFQV